MYRIIRYSQPRITDLPSVLAARTPWSGFETDLDRLFSAALSNIAAPVPAPGIPVDLYEDNSNLYIRAELPGVPREAINVELEQDTLKLSATRTIAGQESTLARTFELPVPVQAEKVTAACENGVLTITLPRQEQAKPRKINVSIN